MTTVGLFEGVFEALSNGTYSQGAREQFDRFVRTTGWSRFQLRGAFELFGLERHCTAGPLIVSALRAEPPTGSLEFWMSLCSITDAGIVTPTSPATGLDIAEVKAVTERLATRHLVPVTSLGIDHGLVLVHQDHDIQTTPFEQALGKHYSSCLPLESGASRLHQWIEDSVDLLGRVDFNRSRQDMGKPPANLLWPWGEGTRPDVPRLSLRLGGPATAAACRVRVLGAAQMLGLKTARMEGFDAEEAPHPTEVQVSTPYFFVHDAVGQGTEESRVIGFERIARSFASWQFVALLGEGGEGLATDPSGEPFDVGRLAEPGPSIGLSSLVRSHLGIMEQ